jgi:hypothetical protein
LKSQFYKYPLIAAVLARHLAGNYVKPDNAQASKIKALGTSIKNLTSRLDTLEVDRVNKSKNKKGKSQTGSD